MYDLIDKIKGMKYIFYNISDISNAKWTREFVSKGVPLANLVGIKMK